MICRWIRNWLDDDIRRLTGQLASMTVQRDYLRAFVREMDACPDRAEHIRLAHRVEQAEAQRDEALGVLPRQEDWSGS